MSAVAVPNRIVPVIRTQVSELDVLRQISGAVARGKGASAIESVAQLVLTIPGVYQIQIGSAAWGQVPRRTSAGSATHGPVKVMFDLQAAVLDSPVRFAKFVAQQVAHLNRMFELQQERRALGEKITLLESILTRRKAVHRARAVICKRDGLTEAAAFMRLREHSRTSGKSLQEVAEAVIVTEPGAWKKPLPIERHRRGPQLPGVRPALARDRNSY